VDASDAPAPARLNLLSALRAHVLLIVCVTLAFGAAGAVASMLLPRTYAATASVLLQPLDGNPYSPSAQGSELTNLETEAQVITSDVIAREVADELPASVGSPNVTNGVSVAIAPNTQIVQVTYRHRNADTAEAVAEQYAESYLAYRSDRRDTFLENRRTGIQERIDTLTDRLEVMRRKDLANDDPDVRSVGGQLLNLRLQLAALDTGIDTTSGEVIVVPVSKVSGVVLPLLPATLSAMLFGLFLGCGWAVLKERRGNVLRTIDDIEHLGLPVLGHVGSPKVGESVAGSPSDAALMVGAVMNRRVDKPATIAVSMLTDGASTDDFSEDLAHALAQGQQGVLLVAGVSAQPSRQPGLAEALTGNQDLTALTRRVPGGFSRMEIGKKPQVAERLYGTARMDSMLERATSQFEWVIVQGGATDQTVGRSLVGACRYWIPLVILGSTSRDDLERGLNWARTTGTQALGVVAVDRSARRGRQPEPTAADDE
jgi:capsular polysaccharide biosynthesis protein